MTSMIMTILMTAASLAPQVQETQTILVDELHAKMQSGERIVILDVRTSQEYASETGHLNGAILIPLQDLTMRMEELKPFANDTLYVYCRTDNRSRAASAILASKGYSAVVVKGGITAWNAKGYPVVKEERK